VIHTFKTLTCRCFFYLLILVAIALSLVRFFLLDVDSYKKVLEGKIYQLTEIPVEIGEVKANMRGFSPGIILKNIRVLNADNSTNHHIKLDEIRISISLLDLIRTQQLLPSSWLTLVGAKLSVVRKEDGRLSIKGLNSDQSEQPFWLFQGGRYELLKSEVTWLDKKRRGEPLKFDSIDLLLKNAMFSENHEIHLLSQLPDSLGESLRVSMSIQGNVFEKDSINGVVYIKGKNIQLAEVLTGELQLGLKITEGQGDFEVWSQLENSKRVALTGNIQAKKIRVIKKTESFSIDHLSTEFNGVNKQMGWQFGVANFSLIDRRKIWPSASFVFSGNQELTQFAASIDQLDLQQASELAQFFLPLKKEQKKFLARLKIKGQVKDFSSYINVEKKTYAVNGEFENIFTSSISNIPQVRNLSASIQGTDKNGIIGFDSNKSHVFFPQIFRKAIPINELTGFVSWEQTIDSWLLGSERLVFNVEDALSETRFKFLFPKNNESPFIDLQSSFSQINDVRAIPEYYPAKKITKNVLNWLDNVFVSGQIEQGGVLFSGKLNEFPFAKGEGVFEVLFDAKNLELEVSPHWPHLDKVNAEFEFQRQALLITSEQAEIDGMRLTHVLTEIPLLGKSKFVSFKGRAVGKAAHGLSIVQKTPEHMKADKFLEIIQPSGDVGVYMEAKIPLVAGDAAKVKAQVRLKKVGIKIKPLDLQVTDIEGLLQFNNNGWFADDLTAKSLGGDLNIKIDTQDLNTEVSTSGATNIRELQKQFSFLKHDLLVQEKISGTFDYQLVLDLPKENEVDAKLNIKTDWQGVSVNFPGLLNKKAIEEKNLELNFILNSEKLLPVSLNYNDGIKAAMYVDKQQNILHSANIAYGGGPADFSTEAGVRVYVQQALFDISEWVRLIGNNSGKEGIIPERLSIGINTEDLVWNDQHLGQVEVMVSQDDQQWLGYLNSLAAKGDFFIPFEQTDQNKIKLKMEYLSLSEIMKMKFQQESRDVIDNKEFPLVDIYSKQFWWNDTDLGRLEIETERFSEGIGFKQIHVLSTAMEINMTADWIRNEKESFISFQGEFLTGDLGDVLFSLGLNHDLKETRAIIKYTGELVNAPYQFSLANLDAEVDMVLDEGRILSIEPGFGRALGILAFEQWIKRLTFDFGDLYKKGLSFNSITGVFKVEKGVAHTDNLLVDAVPAEISILGETNLVENTLDYTVSVIPKSSDALPIAGTIIGSIAGTITKAVDSDYKDGYFFGSKYQATGKWGNIKLTNLHEHNGVFNKAWAGFADLFREGSVVE